MPTTVARVCRRHSYKASDSFPPPPKKASDSKKGVTVIPSINPSPSLIHNLQVHRRKHARNQVKTFTPLVPSDHFLLIFQTNAILHLIFNLNLN